ncbi:50S ribosomal protein L10 [Ilumatobacter nonamiensis]|uniref:50S ribosomal protein L10 n=1 Tax=Ilumatobacter nonamiensis TaxID=467093 RepID=UPI00058D9E9B|nr:50S ribosomal protein L10 [Ilumatobacter nonamiensis]
MSEKTHEPRADKVAVVEEVTAKLNEASAVFVSEYRGLTVGQLADLRKPLREAGAEHKVYKNTLVKLAAQAAGMEGLTEHLVGPTALTFVSGDVAAAAKALTEQAKATPALVVKGGMMGETVMSADDLKVLADLPPRDVLLAKFAGALQAPLVKTAGLLQAMPRNFAYGLSALVEEREAAA